jgi:hypothetical protein
MVTFAEATADLLASVRGILDRADNPPSSAPKYAHPSHRKTGAVLLKKRL